MTSNSFFSTRFILLGVLLRAAALGQSPIADPKQIIPHNHFHSLPINSAVTLQGATQLTFEFSKTISTSSDQRERAVAFHSMMFIDSYGTPLGNEMVFGTNEVDQLLGSGWYTMESDQTVGTFQWSGGNGKSASLSVQVPAGAEGLVIKIKSVEDSLRMNVRLGGSTVADLLVDSYWHSGYIPVAQVTPEPVPNNQPVWTRGLYFPKFPRTDSVYVIPVHTTWGNGNWGNILQNPDWRISNYNDMCALTLVAMQGIINRYGARVYLEWDDPFQTSTSWIPTVKENVKTKCFDFDGLSAINFLYRRFASYFSGMVIYEPEVPETINLATMYAGVDNAIIVAPGEVDLPGVPQFASVNDLRTLVQQNGWKATIEDQTRIYRWVYDNLWGRLDHRIFGLISPGPPTSRPFEPGSSQYFPLETISRDYLLALKLPCIYLHPKEEPQKSLLVKFLQSAPSPIPVTGVFAGWEGGTQETTSENGDMNIALTWPGAVFHCANFSVFASIDVPPKKYVPNIDCQKILKFCNGAPAATMYPTDGDATMYTMEYGYPGFDWRKIQGQNAGWTIASYLCNLAPVIWNHYVQTADRTGLVSAVNGAGYMYNKCMNDTQLVNYLKYAANYLQMTGLDVTHVMEGLNSEYFWSGGQASKYYEYLHSAGYHGTLLGYGANYLRGLGFYYAGSPAPTARAAYKMNSTNMEWTLNDLCARKPGEELYDFSNRPDEQYYLSPGAQFVDDPDALGGKTVYVPKSFGSGMVFSLGPMTLAPGRYEVKMRMKVQDNTSTANMVSLSLLYFGSLPLFPSNNLGSRSISASEFASPGTYQEISLTFTLDQLVTDVYYWLNCSNEFSTTTDVYVDYVCSTNLDGSNLPVIGTIVLDNINYMERCLERTTEAFGSRFESNGGVVLNPSEYIAALNPEYMIEFAKPILGSGHPAIADAQSKLLSGKYIESLLALRTALSARIASEPLAPSLLTPLNRASGVSYQPTLIWSDAAGATKYKLQVSMDSLFSALLVDDSTLTSTSKQIGPLAARQKYYWRVSAKGTGAFSTPSPTASFAVEDRGNWAVRLTGEPSYISIPHVKQYERNKFTLEFWARKGPGLTDCGLLLKRSSFGGDYKAWSSGEQFYGRGIAFAATIGSRNLMAESNEPLFFPGVWAHFAVSYDSVVARLYVNGRMVKSDSSAMNLASLDGELLLGSYIKQWDGDIDEIKFWGIVRDSIGIRNDMHSPLQGTEPGLLGYWQCDDAAGTIVYDKSPLRNHATIVGQSLLVRSDAPTSYVPLPAPKGFRGYGLNGRAVLQWPQTTSNDVAGYILYRSSTFHFNPGSQDSIAFILPSSLRYEDGALVNGQRYYYRLQSVDQQHRPGYSTMDIVVEPAVIHDDYLTGVFYYPWYRKPPFTWGGEQNASGYLRGHLVPKQLPWAEEYDSRDPALIRQHIDWCEQSGIDFLSVSWWGNLSPEHNVTLRDHIAPQLVGRNLKYCIFLEVLTYRGWYFLDQEGIDTLRSSFRTFAREHFGHPNYLRINGKPVVMMYCSFVYEAAKSDSVFAMIRKEVQQLGYDVYLIGEEMVGQPSAHMKFLDAITRYVWLPLPNEQAYPLESDFLMRIASEHTYWAQYAEREGIKVVPNVSPGGNSRANQHRWDVPNNFPLAREVASGASSTSTFDEEVLMMRTFTDPTLKMLMITSWNEWMEDTQIEPTVVAPPTSTDDSPDGKLYTMGFSYEGYGMRYLESIRNLLGSSSSGGTSAAVLNLNVSHIAFGKMAVGRWRDTVVSITNSGIDTLKIASIASTAAYFTVRPTTLAVAAGQTMCDTIRFVADSIGPRPGRLLLTSNAATSPDTILVSGFGVGTPTLSLSQTHVSIGTVKVGSVKDTVVNIANHGNDTLTIIAISSTNPSFVSKLSSTWAPANSIIDDTIRFAPSQAGRDTAHIIIVSNAVSSPDTITVYANGVLSGISENIAIPKSYGLEQNFPNPFNPTTTFQYGLPERSHVKLTVYNILGQQLAEVLNATQEAGYYVRQFDASALPSGVYLYKLEATSEQNSGKVFRSVKKMLVLK